MSGITGDYISLDVFGVVYFFHWSSGRDEGILVQSMKVCIRISRYLMSLDFALTSVVFNTTVHLLLMFDED